MDGSEGGDPVEGLSFSNSLSKGSVYESDSICSAYLDDAASRVADGVRPASISNEEIHKGDDIIQTYRVEDDAIHGGMGSVWRVHHQSWNTDLAMKRPQPRFFAEGSDSRKADFVAECEHWINLGLHPNIVSCYYVRDIGGVPTIFSEWMEGGSLKDAIQSGRLYEGSEDEIHARILDNAIQTMRGLMYSHENGLIHQDVKPGNILLTKDWEAKVADFGLAKAQSRLTDGEKPLSSGYTLAYCPKEQAEGAEAAVWMDVYAWALTVLEMYLGSHPWQTGAEAAGQAEALMGRCRIAAPEAVRGLLLRCLREPEDGFDSVTGELAEIYRGVTGAEYPRPDAKAVMDTADALNNRALSFIDLGLADVAEALWRQALENAPNHLHTLYNQGLYLWRKGEIDDEEVMRRCMTAQTGAQPELEAAWYDRICGECGVREDAPFGESETIKTWRGVGKAYPAKGRFSRDQQRLWLHVSRLPEEGETTNQYGSVNELWCLDTRDWSRIYMIPGAYYFRLSDDEEFILYILSNPKVLFAARADTGERLYTMRCDKEIKGCALEPNGSRVIIQSENTIQLWNMVSGEMLREAESKPRHQFTRGSFGDDWRFTDGGKYFVQMNNANYLKWTMELLKLEVFAKIDPSGEKCFYRDGLRAVSVPAGEFHFYDCTQVVENNSFGKEKTQLVPRERVRLDGRETRLLTLAGNDTRILAAAPKGQLKLYDEEMRHCLCTFFGHNRRVYDACATDDLSMIVSVSQDDDGTVRIFKGRGQTVKAPWELCLARSFDEARQREEALQAHAAKVEALIEAGELAGAVQALAEAEAQEGAEDSVRLRALRRRLTGLLVPRALESVVENGGFRPDPDRDSVARCVAADPLDRFLAVSSGYSWQHPFYGLWNMDFTPLRALDEDDSPDVLLFSKSGRWLAAAFNDCVLISDIQTRETRRVGIEKRINPNGDLRVDFSDDGHTLLVGRDGDTCGALIDTETGKIKRKYRFEDTYTDYRLSADGTRVYAASYYGTLRELDASDGRVLREVELDAEIGAMTRSPDGKRLYISVHLKDEIIVWDVPSWREVRRFKCDLGKSINARIDASNRLMALFGDTAGGAIAQKIQLRSLPDCRVVAEVETASETVTEVAFSQDGCAMYASCARMVRAWELRWRLDPLDDAEDGEPEEEPPRKAISEADQRELESLQKALKDAEARVESGRVAYEKADARYNTPEREQMSREIEEKRREISRLGFFGRAKKKRLLAEEALLERKVADLFIERREAKEKLEAAQQAAEAARQTLETFRKRIFGGE